MSKLNECKIGFEFEFGMIDHRHMHLEIIYNDTVRNILPDTTGISKIKFDISLPAKISLKFSGKNYDCDTVVDNEGNILSDVYVKINKIELDGFEFNEIFMHQKIKLLTDNSQEKISSYIGFNGLVNIDLPESDVFKQVVMCNFVQ